MVCTIIKLHKPCTTWEIQYWTTTTIQLFLINAEFWHSLICKPAVVSQKSAPQSSLLMEHLREVEVTQKWLLWEKEKSLTPHSTAQQCLRTGNKRAHWHKHPQTETLIHTVNSTHSFQQPIHSHTVEVNELTLPLVALGGQEVFKVFDLVRQLRVQIELCWKLRDPVPQGQNRGMKRQSDRERERENVKYWTKVDLFTSTQ